MDAVEPQPGQSSWVRPAGSRRRPSAAGSAPGAGVAGAIRRVAIVDDDDLCRRGVVAILGSLDDIEVVAAVDHDRALVELETWPALDVLVLDPADTRRRDDHFIGAEVVRRFREQRSQADAVVMVVTGHFLADSLRRRMREADADVYLHRTTVQDEEALVAAVRDPWGTGAGVPDPTDPEAIFRLGVTAETRVNDAVAYHLAVGWTDEDGAVGKRSRANLRLRQRFGRIARLRVVNADGCPPERPRSAPSRPQIERFLEWATRADRP